MFQSRQLNEIARVLRLRRQSEDASPTIQNAIDLVATDLANAFERTSPRFNRVRFLKACEHEEAPTPLPRRRSPPQVKWPEPV